MGILSDEPAPIASRGGEGQKFLDVFARLDADDQAMIRRWDEDALIPTSELWRRLRAAGIDLGRSTVERGLIVLRAQWES